MGDRYHLCVHGFRDPLYLCQTTLATDFCEISQGVPSPRLRERGRVCAHGLDDPMGQCHNQRSKVCLVLHPPECFIHVGRRKDSEKKAREFDTGATRGTEEGKPDYEGFLSPLVLQRYGQYMNKHRIQSDGRPRSSDNWQKGIPLNVYIKSAWRHFLDWWLEHRGHSSREGLEDALCGLLFNVMGYLHEKLQAR